ncbi:MAG: glycosyltransferase [Myxococcota bacterium]
MRVVHITDRPLRPDDPDTGRVVALANAAGHLGLEPVLLALVPEQPEQSGFMDAVPYDRLPVQGFHRSAATIRRIMLREDADLLMAHGTVDLGLAARLAGWRVPVVFEPHESLEAWLRRLPPALRCPWGAVVARTPRDARRWRTLMPGYGDRIFVVPDAQDHHDEDARSWRRVAEGLFEVFDRAASSSVPSSRSHGPFGGSWKNLRTWFRRGGKASSPTN